MKNIRSLWNNAAVTSCANHGNHAIMKKLYKLCLFFYFFRILTRLKSKSMKFFVKGLRLRLRRWLWKTTYTCTCLPPATGPMPSPPGAMLAHPGGSLLHCQISWRSHSCASWGIHNCYYAVITERFWQVLAHIPNMQEFDMWVLFQSCW